MSLSSTTPPKSLADLIDLQKRGEPYGVFSVCSANSLVLATAMSLAEKTGSLLLIESTANQVNQYGGYMGLTPAQFQRSIAALQNQYHLPPQQIVLGGDHLGPTVWQNEAAENALQKSDQLVAEYVSAGYTKIHLDASMPLGGDPTRGPSVETCAVRTARLCLAAEKAWKDLPPGAPRPCYIIGTEVPPPGGEKGDLAELAITTVDSARQSLETTRQAFQEAGLQEAWERVIALVVQPGVEFGNLTIHPYRRQKTRKLSQFIEAIPGIVYEAHSTDYQTPQALRQLVQDHFAILKVGPALTFAFREAVFSLESIENQLLSGSKRDHLSRLREVLEEEMLAEPKDWARYYPGSPVEQRVLRSFSLSDRIRYYWMKPRVVKAFEQLLSNLAELELPATLVSQYLPGQYARYRLQGLHLSPLALIQDKITDAIRPYLFACDPGFSFEEFD
jgi:D-tagatose-1,6-bisphosphate aldolase subunit GatZ/KbaZ